MSYLQTYAPQETPDRRADGAGESSHALTQAIDGSERFVEYAVVDHYHRPVEGKGMSQGGNILRVVQCLNMLLLLYHYSLL